MKLIDPSDFSLNTRFWKTWVLDVDYLQEKRKQFWSLAKGFNLLQEALFKNHKNIKLLFPRQYEAFGADNFDKWLPCELMTTWWGQPCCIAPRCPDWASPGISDWGAGCSGATLRWETPRPRTVRERRTGRGVSRWDSLRSPGHRHQSSRRQWRESEQSSCKTILQSDEENIWAIARG